MVCRDCEDYKYDDEPMAIDHGNFKSHIVELYDHHLVKSVAVLFLFYEIIKAIHKHT